MIFNIMKLVEPLSHYLFIYLFICLFIYLLKEEQTKELERDLFLFVVLLHSKLWGQNKHTNVNRIRICTCIFQI